MATEHPNETLDLALVVVAGALFAAILPLWPYGFYVLLRLAVTAMAIYALVAGPALSSPHRVALALIALLFNPLIPVHLPRIVWLPINLAAGAYLLALRSRVAQRAT